MADGIDQAGRADHLLGEDAAGALQLPRAGRRRDIDGLRPHMRPTPRTSAGGCRMQEGRRKPYSASVDLRAQSPRIHAAELRHGHVALVDDQQRVVGQVLEQGRRRLARLAAGQIARIVLDAGAASRSPPSSRGRTWCAAPAAALPAACRVASNSSRRTLRSSLICIGRPGAASASASHSGCWRRSCTSSSAACFSPVSGSNSWIASISSPNSEKRQARSSKWAGNSSNDIAAHPERAAVEIGVVALVLQLHQPAQQRRAGRDAARPSA